VLVDGMAEDRPLHCKGSGTRKSDFRFRVLVLLGVPYPFSGYKQKICCRQGGVSGPRGLTLDGIFQGQCECPTIPSGVQRRLFVFFFAYRVVDRTGAG